MTTLPVTAEEVHKTGLAELERIKAEERAIAKTLAGSEDLDALFKQMQRPEQLWKTREEVVAHARGAAARAQTAMPRYFGRVPKTPVIVSPVAAVEEPTTADRYQSRDDRREASRRVSDQCRSLARTAQDRSRGRRLSRDHPRPPSGDFAVAGAARRSPRHQADRQLRVQRGLGTLRGTARRRNEAVFRRGRSAGDVAEPRVSRGAPRRSIPACTRSAGRGRRRSIS